MIWLVGCRGMLGTELAELLASRGIGYVGTDRELDIRDPAALEAFARGRGIGWIVNCAAYTAVDKAEDEEELARSLNAAGPGNLGRLAAAIGASVLHFSTDYVFDGSGSRPYREEDPLSPLGAYGRTKAEGEELLRAACPSSVILRTAWLYGRHGPNFVRTMLRLMGERERVGVVADQHGTPTWTRDLAEALISLTRQGGSFYGIYHYSCGGETSWFDYAAEIRRIGREAGLLGRECAIVPLNSGEYPAKARRPAYSVLSKDKIRSTRAVAVPDWRESLGAFLEEYARVRG